MSLGIEYKPFNKLVKKIIDNRGKTCPVVRSGFPLIATNCILNRNLYPIFENIRFVSQETYETWFRGHPEPGDMIFVLKGTPGRVNWVPDQVNFCIAQDMVAIRANEQEVYPKYLFAALRSSIIQQEIENLHVGTLIPHFKKSDFDKLFIPCPSYKMQTYIGDTYFYFSQKIDLLQRQNATLEAMAETLFRQWFIEEEEKNADYLTISDVAKINKKSINSESLFKSIEYLDTGSIISGTITNLQSMTISDAPSRARRLVEHNDIIYSLVRPNQLHYGILKYPPQNMVVSTGFCVITCDKIDPHFIYLFLTSKDMTEYLHSVAEGSTSAYPSLLPSDIAKLEFRKPSVKKLTFFSKYAKEIWGKIYANQQQIRTLEKLRDTLLPKLMSGDVRVDG